MHVGLSAGQLGCVGDVHGVGKKKGGTEDEESAAVIIVSDDEREIRELSSRSFFAKLESGHTHI